MMKEEQILFPMIKQGMGSQADGANQRDGKRA
jgi:iron-sulfur cluster repair protein YtfE (RIC family)